VIHGLKRYPAYKDSGVPWLGEVPEHWDVRRNGRLFAQRNETAFPDVPILEASLKTGVRGADRDRRGPVACGRVDGFWRTIG
jgi:type I restriction enzyme S subunit